MVKQTVRFPEDVVEVIEGDEFDEYFSSKSEVYRFASKYLLDEMGIRSFDDPDFLDKKDNIKHLLEADVDQNPHEGITAINKIYSGYRLGDESLVEEGTIALAGIDSHYDIEQYAQRGIDEILSETRQT